MPSLSIQGHAAGTWQSEGSVHRAAAGPEETASLGLQGLSGHWGHDHPGTRVLSGGGGHLVYCQWGDAMILGV